MKNYKWGPHQTLKIPIAASELPNKTKYQPEPSHKNFWNQKQKATESQKILKPKSNRMQQKQKATQYRKEWFYQTLILQVISAHNTLKNSATSQEQITQSKKLWNLLYKSTKYLREAKTKLCKNKQRWTFY